MQSLATGSSGLQTYSQGLAVTANNLANLQTTGFKASRANINDLIYGILRAPGAGGQGPTAAGLGTSFGQGASVGSTQLDFAQGPLVPTGQPLDAAISGPGFFSVTDAEGNEFYSRAGNFSRNAEGQLVLPGGDQSFLALPPVQIPADATNVSIGADGTVTAQQGGETVELGQLQATRFVNEEGLQQVGSNLFAETGASGPPQGGTFGEDGFGSIASGFLEGSNVEPVEELTTLIKDQSAFAFNAEVVRAANENLMTLQRLRG
ncbi:flagellar hook-basal body protein [Kolteria novifilia]